MHNLSFFHWYKQVYKCSVQHVITAGLSRMASNSQQ